MQLQERSINWNQYFQGYSYKIISEKKIKSVIGYYDNIC